MKKLAVLVVSMLLMSFSFGDKKIGGINMPETLKVGETTLVLNGAGIRSKYFIKLYVGGLYLQTKTKDAKKVLDADELMAIRLHIISSMITSEKMEESTREGFDKSMDGNTDALKGEIEMFIEIFKKEIKEGDTFNMVYVPSKGVEVYKNDKLETTIHNPAFKKALFGIWIGEEPAQSSLREDMLGE
jgi:hypothetical protein